MSVTQDFRNPMHQRFEADVPDILETAPSLSRRAAHFAAELPSFTKGQLAFYAFRQGKIGKGDVKVLVHNDPAAKGEFDVLLQTHEKTNLGRAVFVPVLQAYQPPVNRGMPDFHSVYAVASSTLKDDEFVRRVREITDATITPTAKYLAGHRTILGDAVRHNIIPLIAMGEVLKEHGVDSPITLTFPEVYFRLVKWFHPKVFERLQKACSSGAVDVGLSNAHHSIAPLLTKPDMKREYLHSLDYYLKHFPPKKGEEPPRISLHIPEQAKTRELLDVLDEIQEERSVRFIVFLDSNNHNPGVDISTATNFRTQSQYTGITAFFQNGALSHHLAFQVTGGGDPLPGDKTTMSSASPKLEEDWLHIESSRIFSDIAVEAFGGDVSPGYGTWRNPIYDGKNSILTSEADAEWAGYHNRGESFALYRALDALREFGIEVSSAVKAVSMVRIGEETRKQPKDASWSDGFDMWINDRTQWLRDIVGETTSTYIRPLQYATDLLEEKFPEASEEQAPKELKGAWENYGRALISCPYWWSGMEPQYPNNVPVVPELFRNLAGCGRDISRLLSRMIGNPANYHLDEAEIAQLEKLQEYLKPRYEKFLNNPEARKYPIIATELDKYKQKA